MLPSRRASQGRTHWRSSPPIACRRPWRASPETLWRCASPAHRLPGLSWSLPHTPLRSDSLPAGLGVLNRKCLLCRMSALIYQREYSRAIGRAAAVDHCNDSARSYRVTGQNSVRDICSRSHGCADYSGGVLQGGGHHRGAVFEQWQPFVGLAADAATGDEQVGPQHVLDGDQHPCDLLGPRFVAPVVLVFDRRGGPMLGLLSADFEMPELGVRYQLPVVDHR